MKKIIQPLALGVAFLLLTAPPTSVAAPPQTGIQGQAFLYISYGTPVLIGPGVWIGIPSVQFPVVTAFSVRSGKGGHEVARVATDASGAFALTLHPGEYLLVPDTLTMALGCSVSTESIEVNVPPRQFTTVNIFYFRDGPCAVIGTLPSTGDPVTSLPSTGDPVTCEQ